MSRQIQDFYYNNDMSYVYLLRKTQGNKQTT